MKTYGFEIVGHYAYSESRRLRFGEIMGLPDMIDTIDEFEDPNPNKWFRLKDISISVFEDPDGANKCIAEISGEDILNGKCISVKPYRVASSDVTFPEYELIDVSNGCTYVETDDEEGFDMSKLEIEVRPTVWEDGVTEDSIMCIKYGGCTLGPTEDQQAADQRRRYVKWKGVRYEFKSVSDIVPILAECGFTLCRKKFFGLTEYDVNDEIQARHELFIVSKLEATAKDYGCFCVKAGEEMSPEGLFKCVRLTVPLSPSEYDPEELGLIVSGGLPFPDEAKVEHSDMCYDLLAETVKPMPNCRDTNSCRVGIGNPGN